MHIPLDSPAPARSIPPNPVLAQSHPFRSQPALAQCGVRGRVGAGVKAGVWGPDELGGLTLRLGSGIPESSSPTWESANGDQGWGTGMEESGIGDRVGLGQAGVGGRPGRINLGREVKMTVDGVERPH